MEAEVPLLVKKSLEKLPTYGKLLLRDALRHS